MQVKAEICLGCSLAVVGHRPGRFLPGNAFFPRQVRGLGPLRRPTLAGCDRESCVCAFVLIQLKTLQIGVQAGVTQNHRQTQCKQLMNKTGVIQIGFQFTQFPAMAQDQLAQPMQLLHGESGQIGIVQNVVAVLVVVGV